MSSNERFWPAVLTTPVVGICTMIFVYYRNHYPIKERIPSIGFATGVIIVILNMMYLVDGVNGTDRPCELTTQTVRIICVPLVIWTFLLRAWLLLFK
jgi:hypothetical protein